MRRLRRVYFDGEISPVIELDENQSRKLITVLRAEQGYIVEVLTKEYLAEGEIYIAGKRGVQVYILNCRPIIKPDYKFTVYQCVAKREYMDFIIEKYSELGVTDIIPVISNRSLDSLKSSAYERYVQIAKEAAMQCEREVVAEIHHAQKLERIKPATDENILFHERQGVKSMPAINSKNISMIIGPEGGFTDKEYNYLINVGFKAYTPIDTILKAETAAVLFAGIIRLSI